MLNKLLICIILLAQNSLLFSESTTKEVKLFFIKDINENFVSIVDSIIELEKKCDYYTDSLFFYVSVIEYPEKPDSLYIDFDSNTDITDISNFKSLVFFRRDSHYFFVRGMISEKLFFLMDDPEVFSYKTIETKEMEDLKIIDDSYSYWTYLFHNNKFYLLRSFSWCDPKCVKNE